MDTMKKTVSIHTLLASVRCETRSRMEIEAQFIGHLLIEVCAADARIPVGNLVYQLDGPGGTFTGTTDDGGRIRHEDVTAGDYILTFPALEDLKRLVSTTARRDGWQRTTALTPREQLPTTDDGAA